VLAGVRGSGGADRDFQLDTKAFFYPQYPLVSIRLSHVMSHDVTIGHITGHTKSGDPPRTGFLAGYRGSG
jgi:hypothetical protein